MKLRLTPAKARRLGILTDPAMAAAPPPQSHAAIVAAYPCHLIQSALDDLAKRNLRNQRDPEVRWSAERLTALRHERRTRKDRGTYHPHAA